MTTSKYKNMVEYLEKLMEEDEEQFIETIKNLSDEDFVGVYKEKNYVVTEVGIFGYFGDVYYINEDVDRYLVNNGYLSGTLIVSDEMKDRMRIWKDKWFDCINNKQKNGEISSEEATDEKRKVADKINDMIRTYKFNCLDYLLELYLRYKDEIDTYFILEQRDRIIEELEDEYL